MLSDRDQAGDVDLLDLGSSLGFLLRVAQVEAFEQFYIEMADLGLRPGEFSVLWLIERYGELRQGVLAQALRIKPAHMTKTVRRLEEQGLALRRIPGDDRRSVVLSLSETGRRLVAQFEERFFRSDDPLKHNLSADEAVELIRLLQKMTGVGSTRQPVARR